MRTVLGELDRDEAAALLSEHEEFTAFVADGTTIRLVTELTELSEAGHRIRAFNLIHTMGAGGGVGHGESGFRILTADLSGVPRAPLRVVKKGFGARLRNLFRGGIAMDDEAFSAGYLVFAENADAARSALPPEALVYLGRERPDVDMELRGNRFVAHRRGAVSGMDQRRFIRALAPLIPLLAPTGYRG